MRSPPRFSRAWPAKSAPKATSTPEGWDGQVGAGGNTEGSSAGGGITNPSTAQAQTRLIDTQTAIGLNEYLYQSEMEQRRKYNESLLRKEKKTNENNETYMKRLRVNPNKVDVANGNALNVAFDDLTNPKDYSKTIPAAKSTLFPGSKIKAIPFQYASAAIKTSIEDLTQPTSTPALLKGPEFKADLAEFKALQADFQVKAEAAQSIETAKVKEAKDHIKKMSKTLSGEKAKKANADVREAENYLKGQRAAEQGQVADPDQPVIQRDGEIRFLPARRLPSTPEASRGVEETSPAAAWSDQAQAVPAVQTLSQPPARIGRDWRRSKRELTLEGRFSHKGETSIRQPDP